MIKKLNSSFRDPDGFVFIKKNQIYRAITSTGKDNYDTLINSGLYDELVNNKLLIEHEEVKSRIIRQEAENTFPNDKLYKIIKPQFIPFVSYPYEWCFSQLKAAALATLKIQKISLNFGMSLKDCSAFNIQFFNNSPILIDTLSFEKYNENSPWSAYGQFCRHFLAPLALMKYNDISLNQLLKIYLDGIPLGTSSALLPVKSYFSFGILMHVHLHSRNRNYQTSNLLNKKKLSRHSLLGIIDSLESAILRMNPTKRNSGWNNYYNECEYPEDSFTTKKQIISELLEKIKPKTLWDIGSNTGLFSHIAAAKGIHTISMDEDALSVEINYNECKKQGTSNILPLCINLTNPSPGIGWNNQERMLLTERGPADAVLALALIHHLIIGNNLNFDLIAEFFNKI